MLEQDISDIRENLRRGRYPNEAAVSQGIVRRLLATLGWPVYDPQVVYPEYTLEGRRVDFALCHPANEPRIFIEVKGVGKATGAERQLFEYAFHQGVPLAVLTDGREWSFFLPAGAGSYDERRIYKLDLASTMSPSLSGDLSAICATRPYVPKRLSVAAQEDYRDVAVSAKFTRHSQRPGPSWLQKRMSILLMQSLNALRVMWIQARTGHRCTFSQNPPTRLGTATSLGTASGFFHSSDGSERSRAAERASRHASPQKDLRSKPPPPEPRRSKPEGVATAFTFFFSASSSPAGTDVKS